MNLSKLSALALAGILTFSTLAACGPKEPVGSPGATVPSAAPSPAETALPTPTPIPESTGTPAVPPTQTPTAAAPSPTPETAKPSAAPAPTPETTPAPTPSPAPSASVVQEIWADIAALSDPPEMADVDGELLSALYGIDEADLEDYICKMPLMNVHATEFFIAKVKDGRMDAVKAGIQSRQAALLEQWSMYLPDQLELVENYQLVTRGNYVLFAVSEDADSAAAAFNSRAN